ncbi:hypothetical protein [Shewanella woodyi]|uniref:hypothetical protein n=1 Tax=Shewanella woodyi TaxID=60961 RepID=UPI0007EC2164|nr:hypothetical protein [Shewanella woodyi]
MILKELYLYPDLVDFKDNIVHPFRDQSRSICNYLERVLKQIKYDSKAFKRICFIGKSQPSSECFVNSSKVLITEIYFDENKYKSLEKNQLNTFFSQMITSGIEKCQEQYEIPKDELLKGLAEFYESGYVNRWTFKTKLIKGTGVKFALECELAIDHFCLNLVTYKSGEMVSIREILKTEPDEIVFTPMFKDIFLEGDSLVITDKFGDKIFSTTFDELDV